jgi:hypothetical protein
MKKVLEKIISGSFLVEADRLNYYKYTKKIFEKQVLGKKK